MVLRAVSGVGVGCSCGMGFLLVCSGLEFVVWCRRFGSCPMVGIHALHCRRLRCAGAVVFIVGRVHYRLPFPVILLVFGWAGVLVCTSVEVVAVFVC